MMNIYSHTNKNRCQQCENICLHQYDNNMEATTFLPLGMGLIVIGAGLGIGRFAAAAAEGIARQPEAADKITGAVNLPLFLLEGVAILAEVFTFLMLIL
jgi:F-type H+-transporting ATPase subunit c